MSNISHNQLTCNDLKLAINAAELLYKELNKLILISPEQGLILEMLLVARLQATHVSDTISHIHTYLD